jgi:DNA-binding NarL/FixJ family response regulator
MSQESIVAAVINSSPDVVDLLRRAFEPTGIVMVSVLSHEIREGKVDLDAFVRQHDPEVIIYDVAPPYDGNWNLFQHICRLDFMRSRNFVLTSTNAARVQSLAGSHRRVYEIVGKPLDLDEIVRAVKEAARGHIV